MNFTVYFSEAGVPSTGLTVYISIWQITDGDVVTNPITVASATAMTEIGEGFYFYPYPSANDAYDYSARADGGAALGAERYAPCITTTQGNTETIITDVAAVQTTADAIEVDTGTTLPAEHTALGVQNTAIAGQITAQQVDITFIRGIEGGSWAIAGSDMIFKDEGGSTIATFTLVGTAPDYSERNLV